MNYLEAILLGALQGLTEFLPVSSSGHLALGRHLLGLGDIGVTFDLLLHAATLLTVVLYFRKRLFSLVPALWDKSLTEERHLIGFLFIGTLPIIAVGFLFKDRVEGVSQNPIAVSALLCVTGLFLLIPRWLRKHLGEGKHTLRSSLIMGVGQCFALLPGISRSGTTIAAGMLAGVSPARAAEFSFLLAVPAITGAIVLKAKDIAAIPAEAVGPIIAGMLAAFLLGLAAVYLVLTAVRRGKFQYFAFYCLAIGLTGIAYFTLSGGAH